MKWFASFLLIVVYVLLGILCESKGFIEKPACWSMYGWSFGVIFLAITAEWRN